MRKVVEEVRDGTFAREWIAENERGRPCYDRLLAEDLSHEIEAVGRRLRSKMSWLEPERRMATAAAGESP